jgi:hypothetical protein
MYISIFCTLTSAGILEQSMGARNQVGIGLSYQPARLHKLAKSISWNQFLGSFKNTISGEAFSMYYAYTQQHALEQVHGPESKVLY